MNDEIYRRRVDASSNEQLRADLGYNLDVSFDVIARELHCPTHVSWLRGANN